MKAHEYYVYAIKKNPKRAQRDAKKQTLEKMEREAESDRLFEMKQQKKKEKHKGH